MKRLLLALLLVLPLAPQVLAGPRPQLAAKNLPRGLRNSNPGNLRAKNERSWRHWRGAVGTDATGYLVFGRDLDGLRAMVLNLRAYNTKYGIDTVDQVIRRWARDIPEPSKVIYVRTVSKKLGVLPKTKIDLQDPRLLVRLVRAIVYFENGKDPYSEATYKKVAQP